MKDVALIALTLLLAALGILVGQSTLYGAILLIAASALLVALLIRLLIEWWPRVCLTSGAAQQAAESIYERAALRGGEISATHVFPRHGREKPDLAVQKLAHATPRGQLDFTRIMILENQDLETEWVDGFFNKIPKTVRLSLSVLGRYPIHFPRIVHAVLPRANLLLYRQNAFHISLVGLDQLRILGAKPIPNFALVSRSKAVYKLLRRYFDSLLSYGDLVTIRSLEEYLTRGRPAGFPRGVRTVLDEVIGLAETDPSVLHVGLFGSAAKFVSGLIPQPFAKEHEADVDLIIIHSDDGAETAQRVRDAIAERLPASRFHIVWGPDERFFYEWRVRDKVNVDIELLGEGSSFYATHPLLGTSVFSYAALLYSHGDKVLSESLLMPPLVATDEERWRVLLKDRKGLAEFRMRLRHSPSRTDPRRIMSLVVRNTTWAITGQHPLTSETAIAVLRRFWEELFPEIEPTRVQELLALDHENALQRQTECVEIVDALIEGAIHFAETVLGRE